MRSYTYLIQYESDFRIATSEKYSLIPKEDAEGGEQITYKRFSNFIKAFDDDKITNLDVSSRYKFGELNLNKMNWAIRFYRMGVIYQFVDEQWGPYLGPLLAILLIFITLSTAVLTSMQVELAVETLRVTVAAAPSEAIASLDRVDHGWSHFDYASRVTSIAFLFAALLMILFLILLKVFLVLHDIWFARKTMRYLKNHEIERATRYKTSTV